MRGSTRVAALAIVPLAAVTLVNTARAQVVFSVPGGSSGGTNTFGPPPTPTNFFSSALGSLNNITGEKQGVSFAFSTYSGGAGTARAFLGGGSVTGTLPANTVIPVAYSFTLGATGGLTVSSWTLTLSINGATQTIAAGGAGTGVFAGSGNYTVGGSPVVGSFFDPQLAINFTTPSGEALTLTMDSNTDGFAINATAIPEPTTYAAVFGVGALGIALIRRWRRPLAVG